MMPNHGRNETVVPIQNAALTFARHRYSTVKHRCNTKGVAYIFRSLIMTLDCLFIYSKWAIAQTSSSPLFLASRWISP